jgi:hypothetical protein
MKPLLSYLGIGSNNVHALVESDRSLKGMGKLVVRFLQVQFQLMFSKLTLFQILEVSAQVCLQLLRVVERGNGTSKAAYELFYFDPNAMDSLCQVSTLFSTLYYLFIYFHRPMPLMSVRPYYTFPHVPNCYWRLMLSFLLTPVP